MIFKDKPRNVSGTTDEPLAKDDPLLVLMNRNKQLEKSSLEGIRGVRLITACLFMSIAATIFVSFRNEPQPRVILQQLDGTLVPVVPLANPMVNKNVVSQLVADAITKVNALDFKNYKAQLSESAHFFTDSGWKRYSEELLSSGTIEIIEKQQLVLSSIVLRTPSVTREFDINGTAAWEVEVPYQISYTGKGSNQVQNLTARVTVVRIPTSTNPRGIAIAGFNAVRGGSGIN